MRIAVNARMLSQRKPGGIATYSFETLRRITEQHPEHQFLFILDRPCKNKHLFPGNVSYVRSFPTIHPLLFLPWFECAVPFFLKKFRADVFLSTDGIASLSSKTPSVVVIHDLGFHHYPDDLPFWGRQYFTRLFPRYAQKATELATVSEFSKNDLVSTYAVPAEKIIVTHNAVSAGFRPLPDAEKQTTRQDFADGTPYLLHVGLIHPRKNIGSLLKAYDQYRQKNRSNIKLILAGPTLFKTQDIFNIWNHLTHKNDVCFLDHVAQDDLIRLYGGAEALLCVSRFEGFGIPVLEAMACGTPVISSDRTALPEVCGDAALLVDPFSVDAIADAIHTVLTDENLRRNLIEKGIKRNHFFNWDKTAGLLWQAIEKAAR
jgi:glycosyltransferase involved in cell wall biosynthesis